MTTDKNGYKSKNPLFFRYTPNAQGEFAGQSTYGYRSFSVWVDALRGDAAAKSQLALMEEGMAVTAVLHAGRVSLDTRQPVDIEMQVVDGRKIYSLRKK